MQFDMTAAWSEAVRLLSANRQVLIVVAGAFFFLPYVAFMLLFMNEMQAIEAAQGTDPDAVANAMAGFYGQAWWVFVALALFQGIGMLGLLTLLTDRARPTVGQALGLGVKFVLTYIAAQLITALILGILLLIPITVGVAASLPAAVVVAIVAAVAMAYIFTKFLLVPPVIAIERTANPIIALRRSWRLTKGHSLRLFGFVFLIMIAVLVISMVLSMIVGILLAIAGPEVATIGQAIVSGLTNAAFVTVLLAVLAATYRQLTGGTKATLDQTFG